MERSGVVVMQPQSCHNGCMTQFTIRLPDELHEQIKQVAGDDERSLNGEIVWLLRVGLKQRLDIVGRLDEYGERWRKTVHSAILGGFSAEEIAERTGASLGDVLAAMGDEEQFKAPKRTEP